MDQKMYNSSIIGKFGEASVISDINVPHDTILISPKEERQFLELFELLKILREFKPDNQQLNVALKNLNASMAKYIGKND